MNRTIWVEDLKSLDDERFLLEVYGFVGEACREGLTEYIKMDEYKALERVFAALKETLEDIVLQMNAHGYADVPAQQHLEWYQRLCAVISLMAP